MKKTLLLAVAAVGLCASLLVSHKAGAQFLYQANDAPPGPVGASPMSHGTFTNTAATVAGLAQTNYVSQIPIRPGTGLLIAASLSGTNAATTGATTFLFDFCVNGENGTVYTTTHPLTFSVTASGTNTVIDATNIPAAVLNNIDFIQYSGATNKNASTNSIAIAGVRWQYARPN